MSNPSPQDIASNIGAVFAQLSQQDIEEFYVSYQRWSLQQQIEVLHTRIQDLRKQKMLNTERLQGVHPTAIELATLARLQSNGVSDVDLLDRMLEQGESWLDRTMQRLDYLEQLDDFISDDYTQWCQHALEGAYDWIDSVLDGNPPSLSSAATTEEEALTEATEELFLQKISNDGTEEVNILEHETDEAEPIPEEALPAESSHATGITSLQSSTDNEAVEVLSGTEEPSPSPPKTSLENVTLKRPNFIRRFLGKIWGS
jgi:hypothetical protein